MKNQIIKKTIKKYNKKMLVETKDIVCVETALKIYIDKKYYKTCLCLKDKVREFAIGFLFCENVINKYTEVVSIKITGNSVYVKLKQNREEILKNKNKSEIKNRNKKLTSVDIISYMKDFNNKSELFKQTGAVHQCAIMNNTKMIVFAEDIGRHNAYDKVIGYCLMNNIDFSKSILLTSGRLTTEMIKKAVRAKIPIVISRSAVLSKAIDLGKKNNITLVGFARGVMFNIYTYSERVVC